MYGYTTKQRMKETKISWSLEFRSEQYSLSISVGSLFD